MMARFIAPIKRESRAQGGAGGARKRQDSGEESRPPPSQASSEDPQPAADAGAGGASSADGAGGAAGDDGVVRPDRATVIAARKERKELKKKSKQEERNRGQNKNRDHKAGLNRRVNASLPSLCKKIARGLACPYGDKCKFSHDIEAYMEKAKELPELPIPCPFAGGTPPRRCMYGLSCRSSGCREAFAAKLAAMKTDSGPGDAEQDEGGGGALSTHDDEFNHLSREVQAQLREVRGKGQYKYEKWHLEHAAYKNALAQERGRQAPGGSAAGKQGARDKGAAGASGAHADQDMEAVGNAAAAGHAQGAAGGEGGGAGGGEAGGGGAGARGAAAADARSTPGLVVPPATPALATPVRQPSPGAGGVGGGTAAGAHTHVSAHELGARLLAQGRAAEGAAAGGGGSSSATPIPGVVAGGAAGGSHGLPVPPATPAPSSPGGAGAGVGGREAGAEFGVSAYELGARLRREEKKRLDFEGKTVLAPLTTVGNLPFRLSLARELALSLSLSLSLSFSLFLSLSLSLSLSACVGGEECSRGG